MSMYTYGLLGGRPETLDESSPYGQVAAEEQARYYAMKKHFAKILELQEKRLQEHLELRRSQMAVVAAVLAYKTEDAESIHGL